MNKCIYCLKTEPDVSFNTRDHIILRSLGGLRRLKKGIVCDICNNTLSIIEKRFIKDSIISIPKQFIGPRGRHGSFKTNLHIFKSVDSNEISIGYIEQGGFPKIVDQFYLEQGKYLKAAFQKDDNISIEEKISRIIELISNAEKEKIIYIYEDEIKPKEPILAIHNNKLFAFVNCEEDIKLINFIIENIIRKRQIKFNNLDKYEEQKYQIRAKQRLDFNIDDFNRVICKMILNSIAHYFGHEVALKNNFDELRKYVLTGKSDYTFVAMNDKEHDFQRLWSPFLQFREDNHILVIGRLSKEIIGLLNLYDGSFSFAVRISNADFISKEDLYIRMIICNYKRNVEYEVFEKIVAHNKKLEKKFRKEFLDKIE